VLSQSDSLPLHLRLILTLIHLPPHEFDTPFSLTCMRESVSASTEAVASSIMRILVSLGTSEEEGSA
jgi:hypothetical protein